MEIIRIYETYKEINKQYDQIIEKLISEEEIIQNSETLKMLQLYKEKFEDLMNQTSAMETKEDNEKNIKDLKYLLTDNYFLALDLCHFYTYSEIDRLKLRVLNYLNKKRRSELFGETR